MYLIVKVWAGGFTGAAHPSDDFAPFDHLTGADLYPEHMTIEGFVTIAVIDLYVITETIAVVAGCGHATVGGSINRCSLGCGKIWACPKLR